MSSLRQGVLVPIERDRADIVGLQPRAVYFIEESAGVYVAAIGNKAGEADAYLKEESSGVFVLDSSVAEEDRTAFYFSDNQTVTI